jgi:hypothetical protein
MPRTQGRAHRRTRSQSIASASEPRRRACTTKARRRVTATEFPLSLLPPVAGEDHGLEKLLAPKLASAGVVKKRCLAVADRLERGLDKPDAVRKALVCVILGATTAGAGAARVRAGRIDRASAHALLADATAYVRVSMSHRVRLRTAARTFIEHVESSCPGALANAPPAIVEHGDGGPPPKGSEATPAQRTTSQTFLTLALGELRVVTYAPIRRSALAFANELAHLRWTKSAAASAVADFSRSIIATLALSPPDLCADARGSASMGFAAAPPEATQFVQAFRAATLLSKGRSLIELANMTRPFLAHSDRNILARFGRLWTRAEPLLRIGDATQRRLLRAVFAQPRP